MHRILVWIDRDSARLMTYSGHPSVLVSDEQIIREHHQPSPFLRHLVEQLEGASKILIVGPGVSKYRLYAYLRETYASISKKVVACEDLEYAHDARLRLFAEKYLRSQAD